MLSLPEFDTYHILEKYAKDPDHPSNILALRMLKRRARLQIQWRVLNSALASESNIETLWNVLIGCGESHTIAKKTDMSQMNEAELMDMYNKALAQVGMSIDPEALAKAQQQQ